jgi:tetratricopeptide (TPR) repeat protein
MKANLRRCAALVIGISEAVSGRAAQATSAWLAPPLVSAPAASPPATGITAPPADTTAPAGSVIEAPRSETPSPRDQLDAEREARARYAAGEAAFKAGRYRPAVVEFEAGFAAVPKPGFLLNIGHAYRRLGDLHKARAAYKKFLLVDPTSTLHGDVLSLLGELDSALADDDRADGLAARAIAASLVPPPVEGQPGHAGVNLAAHTPSAVPSLVDPPRPFYRRAWFWMAVGAVAIGTAVGIYAARMGADERVHTTGSLGVIGLVISDRRSE